MSFECDRRCGEKMDRCNKYGGSFTKCRPITIGDFSESELNPCEMNEVCQLSSIYGNDLLIITDDDIEALKAGKVLYRLDEYGLFVAYKKGE